MRFLFSSLLTLGLAASTTYGQKAGTAVTQQGHDCVINQNASNSSATLTCYNLDPQVAEQLSAIAAETRRGDAKLNLIISLLRSQIRLNATIAKNVSGANPSSLKTRAFNLSGEILQFLVNRQVVPGYGQGGYGGGGFGGTDTSTAAYQKETIEMYTATFQDRVFSIRDALAKEHLTDKQLDIESRNPGNAYSIKEIAQSIVALAEKLK